VSAVGTAIVTVLGVATLYRWALFPIALDLTAVVSALTYAITETKHRTFALWLSNSLLAALLAGIAIDNIIPSTQASTVDVIANQQIDLSNEAGASPSSQSFSGLIFYAGDAETANCYATVGHSIWLYFYQDSGDFGWAPLTDFHYENGFSEQLPSHC
jgi:hypothetical protein